MHQDLLEFCRTSRGQQVMQSSEGKDLILMLQDESWICTTTRAISWTATGEKINLKKRKLKRIFFNQLFQKMPSAKYQFRPC